MTIEIKSTKRFKYLPCGHAQWFDQEPDGSPGECASVHGYDREVEFTFAGEIDEHGWIVPFGELKPIKQFLEYYFDHVTVLPADDPRIGDIPDVLVQEGGLLGTVRILPSGVSMEMSSLFIWEHVNAYIYEVTQGHCYVERVEVFEHDRNAGQVVVERDTALAAGAKGAEKGELLLCQPCWKWEAPIDAVARLRG